ncbi:MAG TPA: hypothetical protein VFS43_47265 [Polyangiaceae bacterium]|nr:hypothetical protein [Polyangiaceae bacterium]
MASRPPDPPFHEPFVTERYRRVYIGRVLIVRWLGAVAPGDFTDIVHESGRYFAQTGAKILHLSIQSASHPPLTSEVRAEAVRVMSTAFKYYESIHNVIESQGFTASVIRSVVLAISMATGLRGKVFTYTSIDDALDDVSARASVGKLELLNKARDAGVTLSRRRVAWRARRPRTRRGWFKMLGRAPPEPPGAIRPGY